MSRPAHQRRRRQRAQARGEADCYRQKKYLMHFDLPSSAPDLEAVWERGPEILQIQVVIPFFKICHPERSRGICGCWQRKDLSFAIVIPSEAEGPAVASSPRISLSRLSSRAKPRDLRLLAAQGSLFRDCHPERDYESTSFSNLSLSLLG